MSTTPLLTEVVLPGVVEPDGVIVRQRPVPAPGRRQALVELLARGVSFAESSMRRNRYPGQPKFPFVLGYNLVGRVGAVGLEVDPGLAGRRVAAVVKTGGWTTHALLDARDLVPIPDAVDAAEAETVLVNGITAWQMLHRKARARAGQTVLVHGASGGVGTVLVQLARHAGVRVIGTGSSRNHDRLRDLGVEPLDYRDPQLVARVRELAPGGVDAAFDNIGGESFKRSFGLLARGGTVTLARGAVALPEPLGSLAHALRRTPRRHGRRGLAAARPQGRHPRHRRASARTPPVLRDPHPPRPPRGAACPRRATARRSSPNISASTRRAPRNGSAPPVPPTTTTSPSAARLTSTTRSRAGACL